MKGRESGMPVSWQWEEFYDPRRVVDLLGCTSLPGDAVEFGCGYGTFTLPVARGLAGTIHALDMDPEMIDCVSRLAMDEGIGNIEPTLRDFMEEGTGLPNDSVVHAMAFNILHIEDPLRIFREAFRILTPGGTLSIIHWRTDVETPRGPSLDIRPTPGLCFSWGARAGFEDRQTIHFGPAAPWHYGLLLTKPFPEP